MVANQPKKDWQAQIVNAVQVENGEIDFLNMNFLLHPTSVESCELAEAKFFLFWVQLLNRNEV